MPDTVFQLASVSKAVGSTVIAGVVGQKKVAWDDSIVMYTPGFTLGDPYVSGHVTLADMYSHRSGLPGHAGDLLEDMGYDQEAIFSRLRDYPLFPFRNTYMYTNFGLTAAAEAVASATGMPWSELSKEVLYAPLSMNSTSSLYADYVKATNRADLHQKIDGKWVAGSARDPDAQSPAGGVSSSVSDMAKWLRLQLAMGKDNGTQVVDADALFESHLPQITSSPAASAISRSGFYGLGYNVSYDGAGRLLLSHSGGFGTGAATAFSMLPSEQLGIVALTNGMPVGLPEALNSTFMDLVVAGRPTRDWLKGYGPLFAAMFKNPSELAGKSKPTSPTPAHPDATYVGTYNNALYGPIMVATGPSGLVLSQGPAPNSFEMTHWDADTFSYMPTGENALGIAAVTFTVGSGANATSVDVENLNGDTDLTDSLGTFTAA
jgi:CubicO group peptidase (beta-lactamase class C family)